jgi:transposase
MRAARQLRLRYLYFAIEDEQAWSHKRMAKEEQTARRKRQNRDLSARYEFITICERYGAVMIPVPSRNSTRQMSCCGVLAENTADVLIACPACGRVVDKDYHAGDEILVRGKEALAKHAAA